MARLQSPRSGSKVAATVSSRPMKLRRASRRQSKPAARPKWPGRSTSASRPPWGLSTSLAKCRAAAAPRLKPKRSNSRRRMVVLELVSRKRRNCAWILPGLSSTRCRMPVSPRPLAWAGSLESEPPLVVPMPSR
ncbi:hypothetical protein D9M68_899840 [compost metagenome]